ncbi:MAG: nucleoside recognition domain-containing protein, partial [Plesiomonas shigelloides]
MPMSTPTDQNKPVRWGAYVALAFALIFFSGAMKSTGWQGVFDFTTLNGTFGKLVSGVKQTGDAITTSTSTLRGAGGDGAMEGFLFAFGLIPTVMFALGVINVLEHYGALDAARKLLSPLLRPLMGISGNTGLAMIGSLQSTDVGASLTRALADDKQITEREKDVFTM